MKLINLFACTLFLLILGACDQLVYKTDVAFLKKHIPFDSEPVQAQYNVREDWGMDCPNLTQIKGILKFSDKDFRQLVDSLKKEKSHDLSLSKDDSYYKRWYPSHVKKLFKENKVVTVYYRNLSLEKNKNLQYNCFITDSCEVVISLIHCE